MFSYKQKKQIKKETIRSLKMKSVCWFAARCRVGVHKGRREMCGWGRSSSSSSSSSSSILYSVGGGYLLASYIGKASLSRFFRFRHFLLFPLGFHHLVHFFWHLRVRINSDITEKNSSLAGCEGLEPIWLCFFVSLLLQLLAPAR